MGGAETSLVELLASVRAAEPGWQLSLILGADGPLAARAKALGVAVRIVPLPHGLARVGDSGIGISWLSGMLPVTNYLRQLAGILRAERPDLIHTTGFKMHLLS